MSRVILVTQFDASPVGHGGNHRAYQIAQDLQSTLRPGDVHVLSLQTFRQHLRSHHSDSRQNRLLTGLRHRFARYVENPMRLLHSSGYRAAGWTPPGFLAHYLDLVEREGNPDLVIVEHSGFAAIVSANRARGIPTLACPQNLESLDLGAMSPASRLGTASRMLDLAAEIGVLSECDYRLCLSRVETGLLGGLGLPTGYYPYLPVGTIRRGLERLRSRRSQSQPASGLFLMVGSAGHESTREAFTWFVNQIRASGLPQGVRIVVGGSRTEDLLPAGEQVPGLELRGRLPQEELEHYLMTAQAVLVPQFRGFGALTRLAEMACAGVPVIVSSHPTVAVDVPPGVHAVADHWDAWCAALASKGWGWARAITSAEAYGAWEQSQPKALSDLVSTILPEQ